MRLLILNLIEYLERLMFEINGFLKLNCINFLLIVIVIILKIKYVFVYLFNIKIFFLMIFG